MSVAEPVVQCIDELGKHSQWAPLLAEARHSTWCKGNDSVPSFLLLCLAKLAALWPPVELWTRVEGMLMGSDTVSQVQCNMPTSHSL